VWRGGGKGSLGVGREHNAGVSASLRLYSSDWVDPEVQTVRESAKFSKSCPLSAFLHSSRSEPHFNWYVFLD